MPKQSAGVTAGLNSPLQDGGVGWCILVAKGPALLLSTPCSWEVCMASAVMGNVNLQLQMCLAMMGTGHASMSLVQSFSAGFHAAQQRRGQGNTRHNYKASQALVGMMQLSRDCYGRS